MKFDFYANFNPDHLANYPSQQKSRLNLYLDKIILLKIYLKIFKKFFKLFLLFSRSNAIRPVKWLVCFSWRRFSSSRGKVFEAIFWQASLIAFGRKTTDPVRITDSILSYRNHHAVFNLWRRLVPDLAMYSALATVFSSNGSWLKNAYTPQPLVNTQFIRGHWA